MNATEQILHKLGIDRLTPMQQAVSEADSRHDVVVLSPTGTGKTLAYMLPLIKSIDTESDAVQAVVVVPGRELALQSQRVLSSIGSIRSCACYGGRMAMDEHRMLRQIRPQVVFATPGRLNDHLDKGNLEADQVRTLVIDEFDKCLDLGFEAEMQALLRSLRCIRRRILLSATPSERIPDFVDIRSVVCIDYLDENPAVQQRIKMFEVRSETKDKLDTLHLLLCSLNGESAIVFLNHRQSVERADEFLRQRGFTTSLFHGGLEQPRREAALYRFANGSANVLVCTDLASRGLDIDNVLHIIHYHLPETEDAYTHRIGRTARWDKSGSSYFILSPDECAPPYAAESLEALTLPTPPPSPVPPRMVTLYIGKGKKDKISRGDILGFLCKKGHLKPTDIGRIDVNARYAYVAVDRQKVRQLLANVVGEKIKGLKTLIEEVAPK